MPARKDCDGSGKEAVNNFGIDALSKHSGAQLEWGGTRTPVLEACNGPRLPAHRGHHC